MKNKMADNGGWSLTMFLVFLFILLLAILMIAFMVNNVETGLSSKDQKEFLILNMKLIKSMNN